MAGFEDIPAEIVEDVVQRLTLHEICALRLVSRSSASKASQDHFKSFYRSKRVDIDEHGLKDFVAVTANAGMGCLIEDFTLTSLVYNSYLIKSQLKTNNFQEITVSDGGHIKTSWRGITDDEKIVLQRQLNTLQRKQDDQLHFLQSEDAQRLLVKAFRNIVKGRASKRPLSLTVDVAVYRNDSLIRSTPLEGGSWRLIWQSVADAFQLVQEALDSSTLQVHTLRLFPVYGKSGQYRSSLACNEIVPVFKHSRLESCLSNLTSLTLSFSDKSIASDDRDAELIDARDKQEIARQHDGSKGVLRKTLSAADPANFEGLLSFLKACCNVELLDLHRYALTAGNGSTAHTQGDKVSHLFFRQLEFPRLHDCTIRGFRAGSEDTLYFLQRHKLRKFQLKNFTLSSGKFRSIFDHCTDNKAGLPSAQPDLNRIEFGDLFEEWYDSLTLRGIAATTRQLVLFSGPDWEHDSDVGGKRGNNTIQRWATGTKRPIKYRTQDYNAGRRAVGIGVWRDWQRENTREFGPPDAK